MNPVPSNQFNQPNDPAALKPAAENSERPDWTLDHAVQGAHDSVDRAGKGAQQTVDRVADAFAPPLQPFQDKLKEASDALGQSADQVRQMSKEKAASLRAVVRDNPLVALSAAAALGMLLARLGR